MAESDKRGFNVNWQMVGTVAIAIFGAIYYYSSLDSPRPSGQSSSLGRNFVGQQDVPARLWQDPLAAVEQWEGKHERESGVAKQTGRYKDAETWLSELLADDPEAKDAEILGVMIPGEDLPEVAEQRRRARVAVVEGLSRCGMIPKDESHVGRALVKWNWTKAGGGADPPPLLVPYEWFEPNEESSNEARLHPPERMPQRLLVLWINEDAVEDKPIDRLSDLLGSMLCRDKSSERIRIIGPGESGTLRTMVQEACGPCPGQRLDGIRFFAATPTAAESELLKGTGTSEGCAAQLLFEKCGIRLIRTTLTDDELCGGVLDEVRLRFCPDKPQLSGCDFPLHIVVLSELDTFYARALPETFTRAATQLGLAQHVGSGSEQIRTMVYLRGVDGKTPGTAKTSDDKEKPAHAAPSNPGLSDRPRESPQGENQLDYLRRLADQLADYNAELAAHDPQQRVNAVVVLGTDIYDTLIILRALRDRVPDAMYLTTTMDAEFLLPTELRATHNLFTVAPYGLRLSDFYQRGAPPFRDTEQTAMYAATLWATGWLPAPTAFPSSRCAAAATSSSLSSFLGVPRRIEIGRDRPFDLTVRKREEIALDEDRYQLSKDAKPLVDDGMLQPERADYAANPRFEGWHIVALALLIILPIGAALGMGIRPRHFNLPTFISSLWTWSILAAGCCIVLWVLGPFVERNRDEGEPVALLSGVSSWPIDTTLLWVIAITTCYLLKITHLGRQNDREIEHDYDLASLPPRTRLSFRSILTRFMLGYQLGSRTLAASNQFFRRSWMGCQAAFTLKIPLPHRRDRPASLRMVSTRTGVYFGNWRVYRVQGLELPQAHLGPGQKGEIYAQNLWWEYQLRAQRPARLLRTLIFAFLYWLICIYCFRKILPLAPLPTRGEVAKHMLGWLSRLSGIAAIFFTVYVIDATYVNKCFIDYLARTNTIWPISTFGKIFPFVGGGYRSPYLQYLDIRLIASRTKVIGDMIYYPFIVFTLMLISRSDWFADSSWSPPLFIAYAIFFALTISSALLLRSAAEKARAMALRHLDDMRVNAMAASRDTAVIDDLRTRIEQERDGAFSLLSNYPALAAILLPTGGVGIWALLEYLAKLNG